MGRNFKGYIYHPLTNNISVEAVIGLLLTVAMICFFLGVFFEHSQQTTIKPSHGRNTVHGRFGHRQPEFTPFQQK